MEPRYIVRRFYAAFAPGRDGHRVQAEMKDQLAAAPRGPVELGLTLQESNYRYST